jgi:hypothetical protein
MIAGVAMPPRQPPEGGGVRREEGHPFSVKTESIQCRMDLCRRDGVEAESGNPGLSDPGK